MQYADVTERFIAARYPRASVAVVAGSTARGERTTTSDIDLLLLGDALFEDEHKTSEAATHVFEGEVFEVFAYTANGFDEWAARGVADHRPVIATMLVEGIAVCDDGRLAELRRSWTAVLDAGPALSDHESAFRRYMVADALDDLRDATDPFERQVIAYLLFQRTAELMLLRAGRWIATGKWLPRRLRSMSTERALGLSRPLLDGDYGLFATRVEEELDRAGGRVQDGFVR